MTPKDFKRLEDRYHTTCFKEIAGRVADHLPNHRLKLGPDGVPEFRDPVEGEEVFYGTSAYTVDHEWTSYDPMCILEKKVGLLPSLYPFLQDTYSVDCIEEAVKKFNAANIAQPYYRLKKDAKGRYCSVDVNKVAMGIPWAKSHHMLVSVIPLSGFGSKWRFEVEKI